MRKHSIARVKNALQLNVSLYSATIDQFYRSIGENSLYLNAVYIFIVCERGAKENFSSRFKQQEAPEGLGKRVKAAQKDGQTNDNLIQKVIFLDDLLSQRRSMIARASQLPS